MKVAVYNAHLRTLGGGEQYSLAIVRDLLAAGHHVDVLARPGTSIEVCESHLGLRLPGARLVEIAEDPIEAEVEAALRSAEYELFVNATYGSGIASRARRGVLVVYFPLVSARRPDLDDDALDAWVAAARHQPLGWIANDAGLYEPEDGGAWSDGRASYVLRLNRPGTASVRVTLGSARPEVLPPAVAEFVLDGRVLHETVLPRDGAVTVDVPLPAALTRGNRHRLDVRTSRFRPADVGGTDERDLGAFVQEVALSCGDHTDDQVEYGWRLGFLDTYDRVVSISAYTASWVRRRWGQASVVLPPPVTPVASRGPARDPVIVGLGRFFEGSHCKKQLELVQAFVALCDAGLEGWTLVLLGGVDGANRHYLERVQRAAAGHPVEIRPNAPRAEVTDTLGRAALFWQATGWGEDPRRHPDRFEHFGIALVEAMSAGATPVALDTGGIGEIVRQGVDGLLWTAADGPGAATLDLARDPKRREAMARKARRRAGAFAPEAFDRRFRSILRGLR